MVLQLKDDKYYFDRELLDYMTLQKNKKAHSMIQGYQPAELHDSTGSTLLHYSAEYGNEDMTEYFIERGCEIDKKNDDGFTPLMLAVKNRQEKTAKMLLELGADIYPSRCSAGILLKNVVDWISLEGDFDEELSPIRQGILKPILEKIRQNLTTSDNQAVAKLLFESYCLLHHVIRTLKDTELTRYYLTNGYLVDTRDYLGRTPLYAAVSTGDLANFKVLLEHGANVNVEDYHGRNMLFCYAGPRVLNKKKLKILRILMKSGISLSPSSSINGVSAAEILLSDGQKKVVNIVLPHIDPSTKYGSQENTALLALIRNGEINNTNIFERLSERYFDVNAVNRKGVTALQFAIYSGRPAKIIDFMLRQGADINAYTKWSILTYTISRLWEMPDRDNACIKIIELFLVYGGDLQKELSRLKSTLNHRKFDKSCLAKLLIAHIVLLEEGGHNCREFFVPSVEARPVLAILFQKYKLQIEEMKLSIVYESITMFDLLSINDKKLMCYAANDDIISNFEILSRKRSRSGWYYYKYVKRRIARAVDVVKCQRKASVIISELTGIQQQLILDKIVDYLRVSDFHGLFLVS